MKNEVLLILGNFLLLVSFFLLYYFKNKKDRFHIVRFLLFLYTISSFCSILFYYTPLYELSANFEITAWPYIIWIILFLILLLPLYRFDRSHYHILSFSEDIVIGICVIGLIFGGYLLLEEIILLPSYFANFSIDNGLFMELHDGARKVDFSPLGVLCWRIVHVFNDLAYILILPILKMKKHRRIMILGVLFIIISNILPALFIGNRSALFRLILSLFCAILIISPFINKSYRKEIRKYSLIGGSLVVFVFMVMTISRQIIYSSTNQDFTLFYFLSRYAGEGMLNFNQYILHLKDYTDGDYCFGFIKHLFGYEQVQINEDYLLGHISSKIGIPMKIFYTFIGFFIIDLGIEGTFVFFLIVSLIFSHIISSNSYVIKLSTLYLIFIYVSIIANGTCLYIFSWSENNTLIYQLIIYGILKLLKT